MKDKILNYKGIIVSVLCCALMVGDLPPLSRYAYGETSQISVQQPLSELSLNASYGKIDKTFLSKETQGHVVLIQNAHAVADAQNSIFNILEILQSNYGIDLVTVEGASKRLDGLFLKSFPEEETMSHVLNDYLKRGELAGVAASLIKNDDVIYEGIEEQALYFKNIEVFIRALSEQTELRKDVKKYFKDLEQLKEQYYSSKLKRLDSAELHFKADKVDLMHFLAILEEYASLSESHENKNLKDLWQSLETTDAMDLNQKFEEVESIADQISTQLNLHAETKEFFSEKQKFETETSNAETFLDYLLGVARKKNIEVKLSSQLRKNFDLYQRIKNLDGEKLYQEIEDFTAKVKLNLIQNAKEKSLNRLTEQLLLLQKNINLELSRKDWTNSFESLPEADQSLPQDIQKITLLISKLNQRLQNAKSPFKQFYDLAIKREKVLFENMKQSLKKHDRKTTAVVLGGFHSEGFQEFLKAENFSFHVITPKIAQVEDSQLYLDQMQGRVSWKKYMKEENGLINVHEAFHRAVMQDALKEKANSTTFQHRGFLKSWRDELIRKVVKKGRASKAFEYTHFIDDYFIEELPSVESNELRKNWTESVEGFTKNLQRLYDQKDFSVSQISQLLKSPALESWITLLPFADESVPARWFVPEERLAETVSLRTDAEVPSAEDLSVRLDALQARAESPRSELRKKIKIDGEEAEMSGGFIVKAPKSWSSEKDTFIFEKGKTIPNRFGFKPNYDPLVMDVEDHLRQSGMIQGADDVLRWSQKVTDPEKAQKVILAVPTHDSSRGLNLDQKIKYFYELQEQVKKVKQEHPSWNVELVINVNGLNQEAYLEELLNFQRSSVVPTTILFMPFGGEAKNDQSPGKGSAVNLIRQYGLTSKTDIVGLMDDDVTFLNETFDGQAVVEHSHVLSNLEFLIAQTRENRSPVLTGSQYAKEFPQTLWRKIVKEPFTRSGKNQIRGISMFTFLEALPPMPSFPINEDLYLNLYFRDAQDAQNSSWRILGNSESPISFRTAATFLSDFRQNYRWNLGDLWAFQLVHGEKKKMIHPQFGFSMFRKHYKLIFYPWFWFRKVFVNHLVGAELLLRQTFSRPRLTTRWAESVPEETKERPADTAPKRSELRNVLHSEEENIFQKVSTEDYAKIFGTEAATFIWRTTAGSAVHGVGASGLTGLIKALSLLDLRGDVGEVSLDYHILQSQSPEGDLFPYILSHLEVFPDEFSFIRDFIQQKRDESLSQSSDEKIESNRQALTFLDEQFEKMAGVLFERYFVERNEDEIKKYKRILQNKQFREYLVRYLRKAPQAQELKVGESSIALFAVEKNDEYIVVPINVDAVTYPDPEDENIRKAWTRIVDDEAWDSFLEKIGFQDNGFLYQMVDVQTGHEYRSYRPMDFKRALDFGVHHIQLLKVKSSVSRTTMNLARAIQSPQFVTADIQKFINEVIEKIGDPVSLTELLKEISNYEKRDAENIYGKNKVSSIMAFVTFLAPNLLEDMKSWNDETYQHLHRVVETKKDLFQKGKIQFHHSSRNNILILSRMLGRERMLIGIPFAFDAVSLHDDIPKVWTSFPDFDKLKLQGGSVYRFKDPVSQRTYPLRHFGSDLLERGHSLGIPVETDKFDTPTPNYPVGFQMLELEHLRPSEGFSPAHDMQVLEINAREFLEIDGEDVAKRRYRSFDDVTDEEIKSWKDSGFNTIWMMGIWTESHASRILNQIWEDGNFGRVASAFAVPDYILNPRFGNNELFKAYDDAIIGLRSVIPGIGEKDRGEWIQEVMAMDEVAQKIAEASEIYDRVIQDESYRQAVQASEEAFIRFAHRAKALDVRILVDFIPNHLEAHSPFILEKPEMFIHLNHPPNDDMKDFFYPVDLADGRKIWVAHGKDGTPWADTAQLNLESEATWQFFKDTMDNFVKYTEGGGVRIDSLQVLKPDVYWGIWKHQLESKSYEAFLRRLTKNVEAIFGKRPEFTSNPFEVLHGYARKQARDFKTIGEVYHGQHPHWQNAGVDVTYAKYSYKWLVDQEDQNWQAFKDHVLRRGEHAGLSAQYLYRSSYLLEDHDERKRLLEALLERLGVSIEDEIQKVIYKAEYYRATESEKDHGRMREELLQELNFDASEVIDRALEAGMDYLATEEKSLERNQARVRIGKILLEKAITPEIIEWSKLLATMIAVIPGVTLTYDGQEEGKVRLISSADWIPPHTRRNEEPVREELKTFYRELHQKTSGNVFRRGEVPVRIPLKGVEGSELPQILAFSRTYGNMEAIIVLNHSREPIDVTLNLTHLGFREKKVSLKAWGSHIETLIRSELRTDEARPLEGKKLRDLFFHRRLFDPQLKQELVALIPAPYLALLESRKHSVDKMGVSALGYHETSYREYILVAMNEEPQFHFSLGFPPDYKAVLYPGMMDFSLTMEDAENDTLKIELTKILPLSEGQNQSYDKDAFKYWFEKHLLPFAKKLGFRTLIMSPNALTNSIKESGAKLAEMGFVKDLKGDFLFPLQMKGERSELRSEQQDQEILAAFRLAFSDEKEVEIKMQNIKNFANITGKHLKNNRLVKDLPADPQLMMAVIIEEFFHLAEERRIDKAFSRNVAEMTYDAMITYVMQRASKEEYQKFIEQSSLLQPLLIGLSDQLTYRKFLALDLSFKTAYGDLTAQRDLLELAVFMKFAKEEAANLESVADLMTLDRRWRPSSKKKYLVSLINRAEDLLQLHESKYMTETEISVEDRNLAFDNYLYELALAHLRLGTKESLIRSIELTDRIIEKNQKMVPAYYIAIQARYAYNEASKHLAKDPLVARYQKDLKQLKKPYRRLLLENNLSKEEVKGWDNFFVGMDQQANGENDAAKKTYQAILDSKRNFDLHVPTAINQLALHVSEQKITNSAENVEALVGSDVVDNFYSFFNSLHRYRNEQDAMEALSNYLIHNSFKQIDEIVRFGVFLLQTPKLWPEKRELLGEIYTFVHYYGNLSSETKGLLFSNIVSSNFLLGNEDEKLWDGVEAIVDAFSLNNPLVTRKHILRALSYQSEYSEQGKKFAPKLEALLKNQVARTLENIGSPIHQIFFLGEGLEKIENGLLAQAEEVLIISQINVAEALFQDADFDALKAEKRLNELKDEYINLKYWDHYFPIQMYRIFIRAINAAITESDSLKSDPAIIQSAAKFITGYSQRNQKLMKIIKANGNPIGIYYELAMLADTIQDYESAFDYLNRFFDDAASRFTDSDMPISKILPMFSTALQSMLTASVFMQKDDELHRYALMFTNELLQELQNYQESVLDLDDDVAATQRLLFVVEMLEYFQKIDWGVWLYLQSASRPLDRLMKPLLPILLQSIDELEDATLLMTMMNLAVMLDQPELLKRSTKRYMSSVKPEDIDTDEALRIADLLGLSLPNEALSPEQKQSTLAYMDQILANEMENEKDQREEYILFFESRQAFFAKDFKKAIALMEKSRDADKNIEGGLGEHSFSLHLALLQAIAGDAEKAKAFALDSLSSEDSNAKKSRNKESMFTRFRTFSIFFLTASRENKRRMIDLFVEIMLTEPLKGYQMDELMRLLGSVDQDYFNEIFMKQMQERVSQLDQLPQNYLILFQKMVVPEEQRKEVYLMLIDLSQRFQKSTKNIRKILNRLEMELSVREFLELSEQAFNETNYQLAMQYLSLAKARRDKDLSEEVDLAHKRVEEAQQLSKKLRDLQKKKGDAAEITRLARALLAVNPKDKNAEGLAGLSQQLEVITTLILQGEIPRAERELQAMIVASKNEDKLVERQQTFEVYKKDLRQATELLEDHRYQATERILDQALENLAVAWNLENKITEKSTLALRERIAEQLSEVNKHREYMLANGSLRDVFRHAEDMINFPEHADEVYQHLIQAGHEKFNEGLAFTAPNEKAKRESRLKSAFHYGRLVLEVMSERKRMLFYERSARGLISQASAHLWLPKLTDDYFMIASMVEAEAKREIIDRKEMGMAVDAPLEFTFSDFEVMPNGKSFRLKQFNDKNIYDHLWRGDTFKVELADGQDLQSFFRLLGFTKDFLEFEMPDTPEAKEEVIKILSQVTKQNEGKIIRTRNSSWIIQRDLLSAILERLIETTLDQFEFDFDKKESTVRQAVTGNVLLDKILGLDVALMPTGEKLFRETQEIALNNLLDQKALEEGYDLDPAQREGIKEVLMGFAPFVFLQGPPGTGKTTATVWQTELLMQLNRHIRILSQTNPGADNVVRRLRGDGKEIVRVGNNEEAIDPELLEDWKNRKAALKRLAQAKAQGLSTVIAGTINGLPTDRFMGDHVTLRDADVVETDESSRATVSESILAVSWFNGVKTKVFVGDHIQLPAHGLTDEDVKFAREYLRRKIKGRVRHKDDRGVDARMTGRDILLSSSFGDRNFEDVFTRQNVKGFKISLMEEALRLYFPNYEDVLSPENFFTATRPAFFFFDVQRRSGTDIVKLINHFYHGRLKAGRKTRGLVIEDDTQRHFKESRDQQEGDITNDGEVYRIIHWINDLMNEKGLESKDIAVISPYKKQVEETDRALLDFATLHSFLEKFNTEGKLDEVSEVVSVLKQSRAIKSWLLEQEIQRMRANDASFDFQRAKRRADERLTVLIRDLENLAVNPSPKNIKSWRESFGLGEKFVTLQDIAEFRLRTLTADSSIGQEFKAVILSLVRSNLGTQKGNQGNAGFMADPIDGMRRLNVATSRAQDIFIMIWDRETFTKNKDADVRKWANHTAGVFDEIRKNPVDWEDESIRIEAEALGEDPDEYAPDSNRSELREVVEPALAALALKGRDVAGLATQASRQLVAGVEQHSIEELLQAIREESQRSRYLRILKQGFDADREEIKRLEIEARLESKHRRHDLNIEEYVTTYLQKSGAEFERRLLDPTDSLKRLNFSFAFELDENIETQKMILEYVRRVEKLKALEYTHDVTIKANIRLMISESLRKKLSPSFRSAIQASRVAHFFELKDNALTSIHMDDYLKQNPQALAYLFSDRGKSGRYSAREVHSRFEVANTLPVTLMMTDFMAADEIDELNDDYLIRLPHRLPFPDAVTYNGENLEVTARALEMIYEIQAKQLIATMA